MCALWLASAALVAGRAPLTQRAAATLGEPGLAVVLLDSQRLLAVLSDSVVLYRVRGKSLREASRAPLPSPAFRTRRVAALLFADPRSRSVWVTTNRHAEASLFTIEGDRLQERDHAAAVPWNGFDAGLRFDSATDRLADTRTSEAWLAVDGDGALAVRPDGTLASRSLALDVSGIRVGSALARLDATSWVASSPSPPSDSDALLVLRKQDGRLEIRESLTVPGAIRGLDARRLGERCLITLSADLGAVHQLSLWDLTCPH